MKTLHIFNKPFTPEQLETELAKQLPGVYTIVWHQNTNTWTMRVKWTGTEFIDQYEL